MTLFYRLWGFCRRFAFWRLWGFSRRLCGFLRDTPIPRNKTHDRRGNQWMPGGASLLGRYLGAIWELFGGLPALHEVGLRPFLQRRHQLVHRCAVDGLADEVCVAGVAGQLLDEGERPPPHPPVVDVLREPRDLVRHR